MRKSTPSAAEERSELHRFIPYRGPSRLMGDDEAATVETITAYRKGFSKYAEEYRGRVITSFSVIAVTVPRARHQHDGTG